MADNGSPALSLVPIVSVSALLVSGWGETQDSSLKGWRSYSISLPALSPQGELFAAGEFLLGAEQCWPGGRGDAGKMMLFFLTLPSLYVW